MKFLTLFLALFFVGVPVHAGWVTETYTVHEYKVLFDTDKSEVKAHEVTKLKAVSTMAGNVEVIGSADSRASESYNLALGQRRANAVAALIGGSATVSSLGESTASGNMALDRNVIIRVTQVAINPNPVFGKGIDIQGPVSHIYYSTLP